MFEHHYINRGGLIKLNVQSRQRKKTRRWHTIRRKENRQLLL